LRILKWTKKAPMPVGAFLLINKYKLSSNFIDDPK